jgi:hypothetical protein
MTLVELQRALRQLRCSGMAVGLEGRLLQAQAEKLAPTWRCGSCRRRQPKTCWRSACGATSAPRPSSNRPVEDWGKLLGDTAAVAAFLDRLLHHAHVLTFGPRSWRTRLHSERSDA